MLSNSIGEGPGATPGGARPPSVCDGLVHYASWLSPDLLLVALSCRVPDEAVQSARFTVDADAARRTDSMVFRGCDFDEDRPVGALVAVHIGQTGVPAAAIGHVSLHVGGERVALGGDVDSAVTDLQTLLRCALAPLDSATRRRVLEFVRAAVARCNSAAGAAVPIRSLLLVREALRDRLPHPVAAEDSPRGLSIDAFVAIDDSSFYICGSVWDREAAIRRLEVFSPEGWSADLLSGMVSSGAGFSSCFSLHSPIDLAGGWLVQVENALGDGVEIQAPQVARNPEAARRVMLDQLSRVDGPAREAHVFPAIRALNERSDREADIDVIHVYGKPPAAADVSIVIPLYSRLDFVEQQLAQFADDTDVLDADVIFVLDSPRDADHLDGMAPHLFDLYRVPFRTAVLKRNAGFAGACNAGASIACGRLLLLLNSDVLPAKRGWLDAMIGHYDARRGIGALGPKLLFEDDSLQHAGMYFLQPPGASVWTNQHYFKGLHRHFPPANVAREVPAVTGACLMVSRSLFQTVGGLQTVYLQGDYEDSDLCLRLAEIGYESWYIPDVELYHLEAQSYTSVQRQRTSAYNAWLHTQLWGGQIQRTMTRFSDRTGDIRC